MVQEELIMHSCSSELMGFVPFGLKMYAPEAFNKNVFLLIS
ncbi:unnamed protein product, partial [Vitis vinifera]|uniref:Uncharacterized protein n=1 Tax=Vitis vinifera TaxID=29760 RepID=D6CH19_VITVI